MDGLKRSALAALMPLAFLIGSSSSAAAATRHPSPPPLPGDAVAPAATAAKGTTNTKPRKQILAYWTKQRIREATPEPLVRPSRATATGQGTRDVLPSQSAPGSPPLSMPGGLRPSTGSGKPPRTLAGSRAERWGRAGTMPAMSIGKIYFVRTDGSNGYCTGSVINAANKNTVWTAGHCIHKGGGGSSGYYRDFIFVPDADNNQEPHGRWTWRYANTTAGWEQNRDLHRDIAAIAFARQPLHGDLSDAQGYQGYKFGAGQAFTNVHTFGYPQDGYQRTDFTGNDLWYCLGNTQRASSSDDRVRIECDMHHGASGGPWLEDLQTGRGWGYIIAAYSHRSVDDQQRPVDLYAYASNHGDAAINVYNDVSKH